MEKINKHNYEAYFLDYIEGNLTADQQDDLFIFLAENPELKAEFEGDFGDVVLAPEKNTFDKKASLKVVDDSLLTLNNVDVWMIESVEGNLISTKENELQEFVKKHKLEKTFATYHATILQPNREEIYADKKGLKVPAGIIIPLYVRVASIAAVGIILFSVAFNNYNGGVSTPTSLNSKNMAYSSQVGKTTLPVVPDLNRDENLAFDPNQNTTITNTNAVDERKEQIQFNQNLPENLITFKEDNQVKLDDKKQDTTKIYLSPGDVIKDEIVNNNQDSLPKNDVVIPFIENEDVVANTTQTEQPYKLITDIASNVTNREIAFSRDKDLASNEYVGYHFKLGSFEFERKK